MKLADYLGCPSRRLLHQPPFSTWTHTRSQDSTVKPGEIRYEFDHGHVELLCDDDDRVSAIFLHPGVDDSLAPIPMNSTRLEVLRHFGTPAKSGSARQSIVLGVLGPWDRFVSDSHVVHVQYQTDSDHIALVTLMRPDIVPR